MKNKILVEHRVETINGEVVSDILTIRRGSPTARTYLHMNLSEVPELIAELQKYVGGD